MIFMAQMTVSLLKVIIIDDWVPALQHTVETFNNKMTPSTEHQINLNEDQIQIDQGYRGLDGEYGGGVPAFLRGISF